MSKQKKSTTKNVAPKKSTQKKTVAKPVEIKKDISQPEKMATIFKQLPKDGLNAEKIAEMVFKTCGGSKSNLKKMVNKYGKFAISLGYIKRKGEKYFKA